MFILFQIGSASVKPSYYFGFVVFAFCQQFLSRLNVNCACKFWFSSVPNVILYGIEKKLNILCVCFSNTIENDLWNRCKPEVARRGIAIRPSFRLHAKTLLLQTTIFFRTYILFGICALPILLNN